MSGIRYRPEIDGLRAIAILSVLFYHARSGFAPGGFMGVDVFFVISGFLITSLILSDMEKGTFSLSGFWERRARRILPALSVVIVTTLIAGWFIFLPFDYAQFGKQMVSQSFFVSNILFVKQGGYFDTEQSVKVLLHTWSLAVEEQYYLFFPIAMVLIAKYAARKYALVLFPVAIVSFVLSIVFIEISQRFAFYLLPFRGWELLAGVMVALSTPSPERWVREVVAASGLLVIAIGVLFYDGALFPGYVALMPVLGAAAIIWAGPSMVARALSVKPMVWIGLLSYSVYLWHWPIITFVKYLPMIESTVPVGLACIVASFALAIPTWYFVEQPVRRREIFKTRVAVFKAAGAVLAGMAAVGLIIVFFAGFPARLPPEVVKYSLAADNSNPHRAECDQPPLDNIKKSKVCQTNKKAGKPKFIVWGDSQADAIAPAFYANSEKYKRNGYIVTGHGCPPILEIDIRDSFRRFSCQKSNQAVYDLIVRDKIKHVFLIASWGSWLNTTTLYFPETEWYGKYRGRYSNMAMAGLQRTIDLLQKQGVQVYVMIEPPYASFDPPRTLAMEKMYGVTDSHAFVPVEKYNKMLSENIGAFREISKSRVRYIDPKPFLCDRKTCKVSEDGTSLYFNAGHVSVDGALYLRELFVPYFRQGF